MKRISYIPDPVLFALALLATGVGLFFIFDAGYVRSMGMDKGVIPAEFRMQITFLPVALAAGAVCRFVRPGLWLKLGGFALAVCLVALLLVPKFGHGVLGAKRWLGPLQPAEFAKLGIILFLAAVFAKRAPWPKNTKRRNFALWMDSVAVPKLARSWPAIAAAIVIVLIDREPDMGTAMVVAVIVIAMLVLGGVTKRSLAALLLVGAVGGGVMVMNEPYRMDRILNHHDRWNPKNADATAFQSDRAELAMAAGGVSGIGIGAGHVKHYIPEPTTDFIMATVGEETGLVGALFVICIMGGITWRLLKLAGAATSRHAMLILYGLATWIGFQSTVNVMMANAFLPAIGVPLPFISYGGSSLVALWCAIGIAQSLAAAPVRVDGEAAPAANASNALPPHRRVAVF